MLILQNLRMEMETCHHMKKNANPVSVNIIYKTFISDQHLHPA